MHTNDGSIHHDIFKVSILGEKLEDALKGPALNPAAKTLENRIPVTTLGGKVAPRRTGTRNP